MSDGATNPMALRDFRARLHGELILPDDDGYDSILAQDLGYTYLHSSVAGKQAI